jgi:hypothetical protein
MAPSEPVMSGDGARVPAKERLLRVDGSCKTVAVRYPTLRAHERYARMEQLHTTLVIASACARCIGIVATPAGAFSEPVQSRSAATQP